MLDWLIRRLTRPIVAHFGARFDRLEKLIMTEREAIDSLRGSVDMLKSDLDVFEASHGDTGELQKQLDAANQALTEAMHEVVSLQSEVGLDEAQITDLRGKLTDAQTALGEAKTAADENTGLLGNLKDAVDAMDATLKQSPTA
jgi:predicted  nucleic acid-binding Zn-ribbon protein